jgi:serine/threonine-protein kinase
VLWEALTARRLFDGDCAGAITEQILVGWVESPSKYAASLPDSVDAVALRALETEPSRRYPTAGEMAEALERAMPPAPASEVAEWVVANAGKTLAQRAEMLRAVERQEAALATEKGRRFSRRAVAALAVATLTVGAAVLLKPRGSPDARALLAETPASKELAKEPVRDRAPPPSTESPKGGDETDPTNPSVASGDRVSSPGSPKKAVAVRPPRASSGAPVRAPKVSCTPPYDVNEEGIRIYKRACLGPG